MWDDDTLPCRHETAARLCPEPDESSPHLFTIFIWGTFNIIPSYMSRPLKLCISFVFFYYYFVLISHIHFIYILSYTLFDSSVALISYLFRYPFIILFNLSLWFVVLMSTFFLLTAVTIAIICNYADGGNGRPMCRTAADSFIMCRGQRSPL
jgi:hypothetical protein